MRLVYRKARIARRKGSHPTDPHVRPFADAITSSTDDFRQTVTDEDLQGDAAGVDYGALAQIAQDAIQPLVSQLLNLGASSAATELFGFALPNQEAVDAASTFTAWLVRDITDETRSAIQSVIAQGFTDGLAPADQARLLRQLIGISERQALAALRAFGADLKAGDRPETVEAAYAAYVQSAINQRALVIARTETIRASAIGQRALWNAALGNGYLDYSDTVRVWSAAPDCCPECAELNQSEAALDGSYDGGIDGPPEHPNCRCSEILRFPSRGGPAGDPNDDPSFSIDDFSGDVEDQMTAEAQDFASAGYGDGTDL